MSQYNGDDDDDGNDDNDDEKDYLAGATAGFQLAIVVLAIGTRPAILSQPISIVKIRLAETEMVPETWWTAIIRRLK